MMVQFVFQMANIEEEGCGRREGEGGLVRGLVKDLDLSDIIFICRRSSVVRAKRNVSVFIHRICGAAT